MIRPKTWGMAGASMVTWLFFALHIAGGTVGLISGTVAMSARKGARLHRKAGIVFFYSMLVMAAFADYLAVVKPGQLANLIIGTFTIYLLVTARLAAKSGSGNGLAEKIALAVILCILAPFAVLAVQLAVGMEPFLPSTIPYKGPVLIAIYVFTTVFAIAAVSDIRVLRAGGISGRRRIERHLWRMSLGLVLAAGSAFTNGLPRLLPEGVHVPLGLLFVPQFLALGALIFWMIRVRFTGWGARFDKGRDQ